MRRLAAVLLLFLPVSDAVAGENGGNSGNNGGGGRLGGVSSGMRPGGSGGGGGGGGGAHGNGGTGIRTDDPDRPRRCEGVECERYARYVVGAGGGLVLVSQPPPARPRYDGGTAKIEAYVGAQKVYESDGSWTAELGIRDGLFRLGGSITRYYERQPDDSKIRLTVPTLIGGVRVDDRGPTAVYLELGAAGARTQGDPVMDSSVAGGVGGVRVEHKLSRWTQLNFELHEMIFERDLRAHSARVGLRSGPVQASFRVLDFNVGPALYGPELGLKF